jgi:alcohol dehydrogenase (NADP+)
MAMLEKGCRIAADGVDPVKIPQRILLSGDKMPAVGLGTFGSDHFSADEIAAAVIGAAEVGYRSFDCAACYGNEKQIGEALEIIQKSGINRDELFVTSKVWNDKHKYAEVIEACQRSLRDLRLDYLNLYLVHWPFPNFHPPGCAEDYHNPNAHPYIHEEYMDTWSAMEKLVESGLVRNIGTSNMTIPKLKLVMRDAKIKPACNEMELHPCFQQPDLFHFCQRNEIQSIGFCPIGSPNRPERDKTPDDITDIEQPVIQQIAKAHCVHPAIICVKWAVQRGQIPIPFSVRRSQYLSNLKCVTEDPLTPDEITAIKAVDCNCRLIKGQVFCWKIGQDWQDLWDINGIIPGY